jgi:hypothetical protein
MIRILMIRRYPAGNPWKRYGPGNPVYSPASLMVKDAMDIAARNFPFPGYGHIPRKLGKIPYRIFAPGSTSRAGTRSEAVSPAARIIPLLWTPKMVAGARLTSTVTSLPIRSSIL